MDRSELGSHRGLAWLVAAVLILNQNGTWPCSLLEKGGKLLLTGCGAATQTGHKEVVVRDREWPGYSCIATGEVGAHFPITTESYLCVQYSVVEKKLLRELFVIEEVKKSADPRFRGPWVRAVRKGQVARRTLHSVLQVFDSGKS